MDKSVISSILVINRIYVEQPTLICQQKQKRHWHPSHITKCTSFKPDQFSFVKSV
jgi:hypothetical protein